MKYSGRAFHFISTLQVKGAWMLAKRGGHSESFLSFFLNFQNILLIEIFDVQVATEHVHCQRVELQAALDQGGIEEDHIGATFAADEPLKE